MNGASRPAVSNNPDRIDRFALKNLQVPFYGDFTLPGLNLL
jgi:hypothetical protein